MNPCSIVKVEKNNTCCIYAAAISKFENQTEIMAPVKKLSQAGRCRKTVKSSASTSGVTG